MINAPHQIPGTNSLSETINILLIEDNPEDALLIWEYLGLNPHLFYRLSRATCMAEALTLLSQFTPHIILSDLNLPDSKGYDTFERLQQRAPTVPIILLTNLGDEALAIRAIRDGAQDYLEKSSLSGILLTRAIRYAIERKRIAEQLRESQERYQLAIQGANDGIWDWNLKTNRIFYSARWKAMLGYQEDELPNEPEEWFNRIHPEDIHLVRQALTDHIHGNSPHFESEYRIQHKLQHYIWALARGSLIKDAKNQPSRLAGSQTDITVRKEAEARLQFDAFHDTLTNLPNRALFMDRLAQALERRKRRPDYLFAVLFLDLDHFKDVNDTHGHPVGDQLLIAYGQKISACLRSIDTVSRLGGDEFAILLDDIKQIEYALEIANRIQTECKAPFNIQGTEIVISASIGIVPSTLDYNRPDDILRDADIAMYQAKTLGRACYSLFEAPMRQRLVSRLELGNDLRKALENQEFQVHYQPIISLHNWKILGFEALCRWKHPQRGFVPPKEFIPIAEESGYIHTLGMWVLRQACAQMQEWHNRYPIHPPISIHVNISGKQFHQPGLVDNIKHILAETHLNPEHLNLEITENLFVEYDEGFKTSLAHLTEMGVKLQIDDFGSGYSSFNYLQRLPISSIKIDSVFITNMKSGNNNTEIVRSIIAMAHSLGMGAIAEGVETAEQLTQLQAVNCESGQGYFISKPVTSDICCEMLRRTRGTGQLQMPASLHRG
jgi:diguanylate cyclase (GGDEF)-like protein/PAS domain S-box-containing protein